MPKSIINKFNRVIASLTTSQARQSLSKQSMRSPHSNFMSVRDDTSAEITKLSATQARLSDRSNQLRKTAESADCAIAGTKAEQSHSNKIIDILVYISIFITSFLFFQSTLAQQDGQIIMSSKLWSDFGAHLPLIRSFSLGSNIPVEYPHFAHTPIAYHFIFYWLVGLMEKMGIQLSIALNLLSATGFTLLLSFIYKATSTWFKHKAAGILALILFCFNGSLGFLIALTQNPKGWTSFADIINEPHFLQFGPWNGDLISAFWNLNIYTNQRHLALSFGLVFIYLLPLLSTRLQQKSFLRSSFIAILIPLSIITPLINQIIMPLVAITIGFGFLLYPSRFRWIPLYALLGFFSIPAMLWLNIANTHTIAISLGFLSNATNWLQWVNYWTYNLGAYFILMPLLLFLSPKPVKVLGLAGITTFIIANTIQLSPDIINNHKLVNFTIITLNIAMAGLILRLFKSHILLKPFGLLLLVLSTVSGIIDIFPILNDSKLYVNDLPRSQTATWIKNNTDPNSIFLSADKFYNPASLAGRRLWFGYSYFTWSMGYDNSYREATSRQIFSPSIGQEEICQLLSTNHIDYVIISKGNGEIGDTNVQTSQLKTEFASIFYSESEGQTIYSVINNCM